MSAPLLTVFAVDNDPSVQALLQGCIKGLGYRSLGFASQPAEAVERIKSQKPSVFIIDFDIQGRLTIDLIRQISRLGTTAVIAITSQADKDAPKLAMDAGACGFLRKPFDSGHLDLVLESSWHRFHSIKRYETQIATLNQRLDLRKIVEKAKGILMKEERITEFDAHKLLLRMSQEKCIPLKSICMSVITLRSAISRVQRSSVSDKSRK